MANEEQVNQQQFAHGHSQAFYPKNYVVAVIDNRQDAEKAVAALKQAGYGNDDIRLLSGQQLVNDVEHTEQKQGILSRIASAVGSGAEEGDYVQKYVQEAQLGHNILNVYARTPEEADHVRDVIAPFHAHTIKHFGSWTITNITT